MNAFERWMSKIRQPPVYRHFEPPYTDVSPELRIWRDAAKSAASPGAPDSLKNFKLPTTPAKTLFDVGQQMLLKDNLQTRQSILGHVPVEQKRETLKSLMDLFKIGGKTFLRSFPIAVIENELLNRVLQEWYPNDL